jgi:hypothetical protein
MHASKNAQDTLGVPPETTSHRAKRPFALHTCSGHPTAHVYPKVSEPSQQSLSALVLDPAQTAVAHPRGRICRRGDSLIPPSFPHVSEGRRDENKSKVCALESPFHGMKQLVGTLPMLQVLEARNASHNSNTRVRSPLSSVNN